MKELIGLPQAAELLKLTRQQAWNLYKAGKLIAISVTGTDERPRPLFMRSHIEAVAKARDLEKTESVAVPGWQTYEQS